MNEQQLQRMIAKMKTKGKVTTADVARRFGKPWSWANRRINPDYMPKEVRMVAKNVCDMKFCTPFETSEFTDNYYCSKCRDTVKSSHFKKG